MMKVQDVKVPVTFAEETQSEMSQEWIASIQKEIDALEANQTWELQDLPEGKPIHGYVDADWANDTSDRKSYSGYIFINAAGPISWESKKQSLVALSSTEAEYVALSIAAREAVFIKNFLKEMGFLLDHSILIFCDNQSALCLAKNPLQNTTYHKTWV
ncbi:secreted RxLR effector protein 161-like [Drosophila sechellia]|uniref:secreted RxLR effector protein 161-like n=1 Tax=Drosophila sechellia TaxID=7238 RepID=UPI0013DE0A6B|nr:secreted RxLR effector protein 161-like [Drosophila sechellia]